MTDDPFTCFLSKDFANSNIIVLQPERNKYLKWALPTVADLNEKFKTPANSFMIFKLDCTAAIRNSKEFITDTSEREIAKTVAAIWNCAEENVKDEYHNLNMCIKKYKSTQDKINDHFRPFARTVGAYVAIDSCTALNKSSLDVFYLWEKLSKEAKVKYAKVLIENLNKQTDLQSDNHREEGFGKTFYPDNFNVCKRKSREQVLIKAVRFLDKLARRNRVNSNSYAPYSKEFVNKIPVIGTEGRIKRPSNAYLLFRRIEINLARKVKMTEHSVITGSWKDEDESIKKKYHQVAAKTNVEKETASGGNGTTIKTYEQVGEPKIAYDQKNQVKERQCRSNNDAQPPVAFLRRQDDGDYLFELEGLPKLTQFTIPTKAQVLGTCKKTSRKPPTIYLIFRNSVQKSLRDLNFNKFERKDVSKISSSLWRRIDSDLKTIFEILYKETSEQWRKNRCTFEFFNPLVESQTEKTEDVFGGRVQQQLKIPVSTRDYRMNIHQNSIGFGQCPINTIGFGYTIGFRNDFYNNLRNLNLQ